MRDYTLPIDTDAFTEAFNKRKIEFQKASHQMGHDGTYLSKIKQKKKISQANIIVIDKLFGIPYEEYKPKEDTQPIDTSSIAEAIQNIKIEIDYAKLQKVIYDGVQAAMINADRIIRESR